MTVTPYSANPSNAMCPLDEVALCGSLQWRVGLCGTSPQDGTFGPGVKANKITVKGVRNLDL